MGFVQNTHQIAAVQTQFSTKKLRELAERGAIREEERHQEILQALTRIAVAMENHEIRAHDRAVADHTVLQAISTAVARPR
ncbi:hypothetical protein [Oerskovia enterophila]|uniref:Uncharacterized protein n=1 Tax=Oerskovia enterophila TaxID=43678 RepID=A0ABX2Y8B8_9CELL|nr:hypothetical protein [Oerskovia enterophila]OCI32804.1 hypothetical protein OERS_03960 [Oerskovia enterophila]